MFEETSEIKTAMFVYKTSIRLLTCTYKGKEQIRDLENSLKIGL